MPRAGLSPEVVVAEAAALVDAEGAGALTLAAVAKRFGVAVPSLYKHVGGLEDLHSRLAVLAARDLGTALRRAATGRAGRDALAAVAAAYRDYARAHPGCYGYLLRARPEDAEHAAASQEVLDVLYALFDGYGIRPGAPAVDAARFVRSTLHGFVALENAGGFAMARPVGRSFARAVDGLDTALSGWEADVPAAG
ncbi:WHG domain-containing protein [Nocardioides panacis]|uniref:WHG domain-containing protein n=1 Tax=Nocardioides panacis TaxID=2849501 RepID=A0A975SXM7_9ACTN|nr:TetR-like C-terminal domain-containing protein [Nocardioides panacis]QWZ07741.1 WHG domain-containing protein [Nocardioides panacis]